MVNKRKFIISDDLFSGFEIIVDLDEHESLIDIINTITNALLTILKEKKLNILSQKLELINFHIHNYNFADILLSEPDTIFYICNHC